MHLWFCFPLCLDGADPGFDTVITVKTGLFCRKRVVLVHVVGGSMATAEPSAGSVSWPGGGGAGLGGSRLGQEAWTSRWDKIEELGDDDLSEDHYLTYLTQSAMSEDLNGGRTANNAWTDLR